METISDIISADVKKYLVSLKANDETINLVFSVLKVTIASMVKTISYTLEKHGISKAKSSSVNLIKSNNAIVKVLKDSKKHNDNTIDFRVYIYDMFAAQENLTTITKGITEIINGSVNWFFKQLLMSASTGKLTKAGVIKKINNLFSDELVLLILKCNEDANNKFHGDISDRPIDSIISEKNESVSESASESISESISESEQELDTNGQQLFDDHLTLQSITIGNSIGTGTVGTIDVSDELDKLLNSRLTIEDITIESEPVPEMKLEKEKNKIPLIEAAYYAIN